MDKRKNKRPFNYIEYLTHYCNSHKNNDIDLIYEGEINHEITKSFTSLIESCLERRAEPRSVKKKIFNVMVESLQNIDKHADSFCSKNYQQHGKGIIIISSDEKEYTIVTGNVIEKTKEASLRKSIEKVNGISREELREQYKKQLSEGRLSEKGGAGLGFIDIARKSGNDLKFEFFSMDEALSFFVVIVRISKS